jgi:hypothetical protein
MIPGRRARRLEQLEQEEAQRRRAKLTAEVETYFRIKRSDSVKA